MNCLDSDLPGEKDYDEGDLEDSISSRTDSHITVSVSFFYA